MFARSLRSTVASSSRLLLESSLPKYAFISPQSGIILSSGYATESVTETKPKRKSRAKKTSTTLEKEANMSEKPLKKKGAKAKVIQEELPDEELNPTSLSRRTIKVTGEKLGEFHKTLSFRGGQTQLRSSTEQKSVKLVVPDPSHNDFPHVPKLSAWDKIFYKVNGINTRHRMFISNVETAKNVVKALELDKQRASSGERITVIEGYPGIGSLSRELCKNDDVEKVVAFEDHASFNKALRNLKDLDEEAAEKLDVVPLSCFQWESFDQLVDLGCLDNVSGVREERKRTPGFKDGLFNNESWKKPSSLLFLAQLPNTVHSEQLVSQLLRLVSNRYWLYRYGRVRLAFICSDQMATRCLARSSERLHGKLTMVAAATADCSVALDSSYFKPYADHFWPTKPAVGPQTPTTVHQGSLKDFRIHPTPAKMDQCLLILEPKVKPLIEGSSELEAFDYITKNLFILRSSAVKKALSHIAPGADNILDAMNSGKHPAMQEIGNITIDPKTIVSDLTLPQLIGLSKMFERWPFRPVSLFDEGRIEEIASHKVNR